MHTRLFYAEQQYYLKPKHNQAGEQTTPYCEHGPPLEEINRQCQNIETGISQHASVVGPVGAWWRRLIFTLGIDR